MRKNTPRPSLHAAAVHEGHTLETKVDQHAAIVQRARMAPLKERSTILSVLSAPREHIVHYQEKQAAALNAQ